MSEEYEVNQNGRQIRQSGVRAVLRTGMTGAAGLNLRGVVLNTYVGDTDEDFLSQKGFDRRVAIYCDVITYRRARNAAQTFLLRRVLATTEASGLHDGDVRLPRPSRIDIENPDWNNTNPNVFGMNIGRLDGDHVVVSFLDDDLGQPFISRYLPHPKRDVGADAEDIGVRTMLLEADRNPRLTHHKGVVHGVDADGNVIVDTRKSYAEDEYQAGGELPEPPADGSTGNYTIDLQEGSTLTIRIGDGANLILSMKDGDAMLELGDAAVGVALGPALKSFLDNFLSAEYGAHQHATALGPSGPPLTPATPFDDAIISTKALVPDG